MGMNDLTARQLANATATWLSKRQWQLLLTSSPQFALIITTTTLADNPTATAQDIRRAALRQLSQKLYQHLASDQADLRHVGCSVLYEYCLGLARNWCDVEERAEDVAQQTTICVLRQLPKVRSAPAFLGFCKTITRRTLAAELRAETRSHMGESFAVGDVNHDDDARPSEESLWVDEIDLIEQLSSQLSRPAVWMRIQQHADLSARERQLLLCHYRDGISRLDLSRHLGITTNALDVALHRAIQKLRRDSDFVSLLSTCL